MKYCYLIFTLRDNSNVKKPLTDKMIAVNLLDDLQFEKYLNFYVVFI